MPAVSTDARATPAQKAAVLVEALPWFERFAGAVVVIKYGGHAMVDDELKRGLREDVVFLRSRRSAARSSSTAAARRSTRCSAGSASSQRLQRRPARHHARGHGRRPHGARRPGRPRARGADQRARPARRRPVRRGRRPVPAPGDAAPSSTATRSTWGSSATSSTSIPAPWSTSRRRPHPGRLHGRPGRRRPGAQRQCGHRGRGARGRARRREARRAHRRRGPLRQLARPFRRCCRRYGAGELERAAARAAGGHGPEDGGLPARRPWWRAAGAR